MTLRTVSWTVNGKRITERRATDQRPDQLIALIRSMDGWDYRVSDVRAA